MKFINPLREFLSSCVKFGKFRTLDRSEKNIVFYSESGQDWHHLSPLIDHLTKKLNRSLCYVSSDPHDPGLHQENPLLHPFFIKEGLLQILFFQFLKADIMVLTMLDLHCMQLKRSIHPVHYIYVFHAMGSTHMVDFENSYDHYDTIFCTGPHQIKEIRKREALKKLSEKNIFEHGYARLENLIKKNKEKSETHQYSKNQGTVLLAPTWGDESILNTCGPELVEILLQEGFKLILRPHYQTVKKTPHIIEGLLKNFGNHKNFKYIDQMGETDSLFDSDILICDWSSMSLEYALGLEKPVLFIDVPKRVRNPEYEKLEIEPIEISIRKRIGSVLSPHEIKKSPEIIKKIISEPEAFKKKIEVLREEVVFNIGNSAEKGAEEIIKIADNVLSQKGV